MKTTMTRALILVGALLVLGSVNHSIYGKERIIRGGETIFLELAPVDPRSIMQGDYMALRFALADTLDRLRPGDQKTAYQRARIMLDDRRVARFAAYYESTDRYIRYRIRHGQVWLGTNAYFFEEGTAERFVHARYGEFRLDRASGEAVLVGLRDERMQAL